MPPYTESERGASPMPTADEEIRAAKYVGTKRPIFISSGEEEVPKPKKKVKKVKVHVTFHYLKAQTHRHCLQGWREEAFASEVSRTAVFTPSFVDHDAAPTIRASNHHVKKERTSDDSSLTWPEHAQIILTPSGKDFSLLAQNSLIYAIICKGIASLTDELVLCQAWPDAGIHSAYGRKLILGACNELMRDSPKIKDIKRRIKQDEDFADKLGELVSNSPFSVAFLICLRRQFLGFQPSMPLPRSLGMDACHIINSGSEKSALIVWSLSLLNIHMYFQGRGVVTMAM